MDIIQLINEVKSKLKNVSTIEIEEKIKTHSTPLEEINKIEEALGYTLPINLKNIYLEYGDGLIFKWYDNNNVFGKNCKWGEFNLNSLKNILRDHLDMIEMANETLNNKVELNDNERLQALVNDWSYWIPIFSFKNGDAFCIDKRDETIRFLEHDVMDGGPYIHGIKIANHFDELINNWSIIKFVDVYYWDEVIDENGINIHNELFKNLI